MSNDQNREHLARTKGSDRIQVNNILAAACVTVLSVLLSFSGEHFSNWMVVQLAAATPLLVTSSLAYAKTSYRDFKEYQTWDALGWVTLSLGYAMLLNAVAIFLHASGYSVASWWFMSIAAALFVVYSVVDVRASKRRLKEKTSKLVFYIALMFFGAVLPILAGWA